MTGVIQGKLYVITFTRAGVAFFRYTPSTDSWTRLPNPSNYHGLGGGGGVVSGKLYLIAPNVEVYDPSTNQWTKKGPLPGDLTGASVVVSGQLYLFGADTRTGFNVPGVFVYDPVSHTWTKKPLLISLQSNYELVGSQVFLNGQPRAQVVGGRVPGNNMQYIP